MGKHDKKTGKGRLDKFYKLAKEQGYRARSAFKLIHLNRKYDLLAKSRCVIDLCAAPGGWLQVAEKYMPKGSLIVGVDLNPIKPLPHVITFVSDITTPQCRTQLRGHLHDWKADLVLHDGAPNVGSAWVQDAFTQNELVLQSLRLATEFLIKGGSFVTKVFRSQDYNSLMWVFGQLFKSVEATKPPSSRNVSAEIFVICREFLAPRHIDPKFLDPKHVFKDIAPLPMTILQSPVDPSSSTSVNRASTSAAAAAASRLASNNHAHANVFMPEKKRRNREGYAEGDNMLFHTASAEDFVRGSDPVTLLGSMNKIVFVSEQEKSWLKSRHTSRDVLANFEDLKVLGKGDFKSLMKWRLAIRIETGLDVRAEKTEDVTEDVTTVEPMDEDEQISEELKKLHEERLSKQRKERRRKNEKKARDLLKMQLNMTAPADLDNEDHALGGETEIFDLGEGEKEVSRNGLRKGLGDAVRDQDGLSEDELEGEQAISEAEEEEVFDSDEERELKLQGLEGELDELYDQYRDRMSERDAKWRVKQVRQRDRNQDAWHGIQEGSDGEDGVDKGYRSGITRAPRRDGADEDDGQGSEAGGWHVVAADKAKLGEDMDSSSEEDDVEEDGQQPEGKAPTKSVRFDQQTLPKRNKAATNLMVSLRGAENRAQLSRRAQLWFDQPVFKGLDDLAALDTDDEREEGVEGSHNEDMGDQNGKEAEISKEGDVEMEDVSEMSSDLPDDRAQNDDDFEIVPQDSEDKEQGWDVDDADQDAAKRKIIQDKGLLTAEAVMLATALVNRQTTASRLIDDGFNRLSTFHKDGLPTWFLDDESKYYKPNIPITKEAINALREKQRALDARPIKKIAEAKARKKFKAVQRVEKAKRKADGVMEADDLNMTEKARQIGKVIGRAKGREKRVDKKVVVAKGANKGVKGRPRGVKGRYKIVDARMRKEVRADKRIKKANKKR